MPSRTAVAINGRVAAAIDGRVAVAINGRSSASRLPVAITNPLAISGCVLWLDAAQGITQVANAVSQWLDQSSVARVFTQSTAGNKPTYVASGLNSLPIIRFDGTDDWLGSTAAASTWKFLHDGTSYLVTAVYKYTGAIDGVGGLLGTGNGASNSNGLSVYRTASSELKFLMTRGVAGLPNATINATIANGIPTSGQAGVLTLMYERGITGNDMQEYSSGVLTGGADELNAPSSSNPTSTLQIGNLGDGSLPANGDIAELCIHSPIPTLPNCIQLARYFGDKYALGVL